VPDIGPDMNIAANATGTVAQRASARANTSTGPTKVALGLVVDERTNVPVPLRFPWLSQLTSTLTPVAVQKPLFRADPAGVRLNEVA
jgi:hypothetical protein